jgi:hypothetical protein
MGGRQDLETTVEFVPRPRQQGLFLAGSLARAFSGQNGPVFHRRGQCSDKKSFHGVANGRDGCTMVPFSRSKRKFRFA